MGELKDRNIDNQNKAHDVRKNAKKQLIQSLNALVAVQSIQRYINSKNQKRCCYFNKQSSAPALINAVLAFNRLANTIPDGFRMTNRDIEALNFEFWEYTGDQTLVMTM